MTPAGPRSRLAALGVVLIALSSCDGGDARETPAPLTFALAAAQATAFPVYYLGPTFAGLPLTDVIRESGSVTFFYGTCEPETGSDGGCAPYQLSVWPICDRNPFSRTGPGNLPDRRELVGRTLVETYGSTGDSNVEVYTGSTALSAYMPPQVTPRALVGALRPLGGRDASRRALHAPRLPGQVVRGARRVQALHRRLGSIERVHRALRISRAAVKDRLQLAGLLDALGTVRTVRCGRLRPPAG